MNLAAAYSFGRTSEVNLIDPTGHLFAYYRFNNNIDSEVNGYHGISSSGINFVSGLSGGDKAIALVKNSSAKLPAVDAFTVKGLESLDSSQNLVLNDKPFSISFSISVTSFNPDFNFILTKRNGSSQEYNFLIVPTNGRLLFNLFDEDGSRIQIVSSIALLLGETSVVKLTYDGSKSEQGLNFYFDSELDIAANKSMNGIYKGAFNSNGGVTLFNINTNFANGLWSVVDYLGFYSKQLIQEEVNFINYKTSQGAELI